MGGEYGELLARLGNSETYVPELVPVIKAAQKQGRAEARRRHRPAHRRGARRHLEGRPPRQGAGSRWSSCAGCRPTSAATRVFINQPAFTARFIEDGDEKLNMRVVVGKPSNQTSFFYDEIEQVDYNPYWGVPQSILVNEMLPRLRRDPGYLDRAGYEVTDARGRRIPSSAIEWGAVRRQGPLQRAPDAERGQCAWAS